LFQAGGRRHGTEAKQDQGHLAQRGRETVLAAELGDQVRRGEVHERSGGNRQERAGDPLEACAERPRHERPGQRR
jgi:hypothetical protein